MIDLGVGAGDHVALLAENRIEWPVIQMAVAAAGAVFTPLNTHYRRDDLVEALNQSAARVILTSAEFRSNAYLQTLQDAHAELRHLAHIIVIGSPNAGFPSFNELIEQGRRSTSALPDPRPDAPGALLYTSGTTGIPKGAVLTHRAMMMNARETAHRLGIIAGDRWTSIIPLFHCAGCIMNIQGGLQAGACYVGVPAFDPVAMFETIETERCTVLSGVPTSYLAMLDHPERSRFDLTSLRTGTCGGADCDGGMLQRCAQEFRSNMFARSTARQSRRHWLPARTQTTRCAFQPPVNRCLDTTCGSRTPKPAGCCQAAGSARSRPVAPWSWQDITTGPMRRQKPSSMTDGSEPVTLVTWQTAGTWSLPEDGYAT